MGREVRRVPLGFDHPIHEVWPGFLRNGATFPPCPDCCWGRIETLMDRMFPHGEDDPTARPSGLTREAYAVSATFWAHQIGGPLANQLSWRDKLGQAEVDLLVEHRRIGSRDLWDRVELPEPYEMTEGGHPIRFEFVRNDKPNPTAAEVNEANRTGGMFHDYYVNDSHLLVEHRCQLLGIEMYCPTCLGHCDVATDEERAAEEAASEAWQATDPPAGDGWQLWETVSEGSPISPVFATAEELAVWCTKNKCTVNGPMASVEAALKFINVGWAPSFIGSPETGFTDGMTAAGAR